MFIVQGGFVATIPNGLNIVQWLDHPHHFTPQPPLLPVDLKSRMASRWGPVPTWEKECCPDRPCWASLTPSDQTLVMWSCFYMAFNAVTLISRSLHKSPKGQDLESFWKVPRRWNSWGHHRSSSPLPTCLALLLSSPVSFVIVFILNL
jgi:hypothetical protein